MDCLLKKKLQALDIVYIEPFSSHPICQHFLIPTPTTLTGRGTNTLNHPKAQVPSPPAHSQNSANASTLNTPSKRKKNKTSNCGGRTCDSGLQLYTQVTSAKYSAVPQLIVEKLGTYVGSSLLKHKSTFGLAALQCFSCSLFLLFSLLKENSKYVTLNS